jgi:acyl-CoA thioesterase
MFEADEATRSLGIALAEFGDGRAVASMRVTGAMVNGTAFAYACNSRGPVTVAAGAEVSFVAAARLGDVLVATAEERTRYGRNGIYDVTVRRDDTVIAEFRGRSRAIEKDGAEK